MTVVRKIAARDDAQRLQDSMAGLIDDGSHVIRAKLDEAADIIQGSVSQLLEDGEELMRAKLEEAVVLLAQTRKQAEAGAKEALELAQVQAQKSHDGLQKLAFRRPLAVAAATLGVGLAMGLALRGRRRAQATKAQATKAQTTKGKATMEAERRQAEAGSKPGKKAAKAAPVRRKASDGTFLHS